MISEQETSPQDAGELRFTASKDFRTWLVGSGVSLTFTATRASKLFFIGPGGDGEGLAVSERTIDGCRGLAVDGRSLYVSSAWQVWRFENALKSGEIADGYDAVYVPKASHVTGNVSCHDMGIDGDGRLVFVNTLFGCLAYLSRDYSFHPVWRPPFVSAYAPEDRCHLTGLALDDGRPAYVTAAAASDAADGWRDRVADGGVVVDVRSGEMVCEGLALPHSPRLHGRTLWVLESGTGYLGRVDTAERAFEPVAFCPGFPRGMAIVGNVAVIGVSGLRDGAAPLTLQETLSEKDTDAHCGLLVVDLTSGNILHWLRIDGAVTEIDNVAVLPGLRQPRAVGFKTDEIARTISLPPTGG